MLYCITAIGHGPMLVNDQSLKCCTLTWQPLPQFLLELILTAPGQFSATFLPVQYKIECTVCPTFLAPPTDPDVQRTCSIVHYPPIDPDVQRTCSIVHYPPTDPDVQRTCSIVHYESSSTWLYQSYMNVPCSKKNNKLIT